jgi:DNA transformation protein
VTQDTASFFQLRDNYIDWHAPGLNYLLRVSARHIIQPRMPVSEQYIDYVVDQLGCIGEVTPKKMFGGVGLYHDEFFFGLIANDVLFFKVDDVNRPAYEAAGAEPFKPYGDESYSMSYFEVPVDVLEDVDKLREWARAAVAAAERKASSSKTGKKRKNAVT